MAKKVEAISAQNQLLQARYKEDVQRYVFIVIRCVNAEWCHSLAHALPARGHHCQC